MTHKFLYTIECAGYVKIGIASDPPTRRRNLQVGNPEELDLTNTFYFRHPQSVEASLHSHFQGWKAQGEWFHVTREVEEFLKDPDAYLLREFPKEYLTHRAFMRLRPSDAEIGDVVRVFSLIGGDSFELGLWDDDVNYGEDSRAVIYYEDPWKSTAPAYVRHGFLRCADHSEKIRWWKQHGPKPSPTE